MDEQNYKNLSQKIISTLEEKGFHEKIKSVLNSNYLFKNEVEKIKGKNVAEIFTKIYVKVIKITIHGGFWMHTSVVTVPIEEEMKKMYERLVVTCQVKTAEASVSNPI